MYHKTGQIEVILQSKFYSDHDALSIVYLVESGENVDHDALNTIYQVESRENVKSLQNDSEDEGHNDMQDDYSLE